MKAKATASPTEKPASEQIDAIIKETDDWRGKKLSQLRALIKKADRSVVEEVKWKKPSKPSGVPVWSHAGIICVADTLKNAVRLTFPKGAQLKDPKKIDLVAGRFASIEPLLPQPAVAVQYSGSALSSFYLFRGNGYDGSLPALPRKR